MSADGAGEVLISAAGVAKALGGQTILTDAGLEVHRGEVVTLIGPNGAGKSTLIRVLLGLLTPDAGSIRRKPGLTVGYLPQRMQIDPALPLTVARFLALAGVDSKRIAEALARTGVADSADKQVSALSGGEFQRVALARAIVRAPELLVLDEPLQGVDITGQAALYHVIGRLRHELGAGVLMVSHDLHLVMAETDHVICLNHHICCAGRPEAVSRDPAFLDLFGPDVAVYTHEHDHVHDGTGAPVEPGRDGGGRHV